MSKIEEYVMTECAECGKFFEVPRTVKKRVRCMSCDGNIEDEQERESVVDSNGRRDSVDDKQDLGGEPIVGEVKEQVHSTDRDARESGRKSVSKKSSIQSRDRKTGNKGRSKAKG